MFTFHFLPTLSHMGFYCTDIFGNDLTLLLQLKLIYHSSLFRVPKLDCIYCFSLAVLNRQSWLPSLADWHKLTFLC